MCPYCMHVGQDIKWKLFRFDGTFLIRLVFSSYLLIRLIALSTLITTCNVWLQQTIAVIVMVPDSKNNDVTVLDLRYYCSSCSNR